MRTRAAKSLLSLLPLLGLLLAAAPAAATPYVDITADWAVGNFSFFPNGDAGGAMPSGLSITCFGGASGGGAAGCSDSQTLQQTVQSSQNLSLDAVSGLTITNNTSATVNGSLFFNTAFSSFDPLNSLGVGVDSLTNENADFFSLVSGTGVGSRNSCNFGTGPASGCVMREGIGRAQYTEAVWSPDMSQEFAGIGLTLAPGASEQLYYTIDIGADFQVPEPSSLMVLSTGLLFLGLVMACRMVPMIRKRHR